MSEANGALTKTCGNCQHWHKIPLSMPVLGECRESPPQVLAVPVGMAQVGPGQFQIQAQLQTGYPPLNAEEKPCSRHVLRVGEPVEVEVPDRPHPEGPPAAAPGSVILVGG